MWLRLTKETGATVAVNMDNVTDFTREGSATNLRTISPSGDKFHIVRVTEEVDQILDLIEAELTLSRKP